MNGVYEFGFHGASYLITIGNSTPVLYFSPRVAFGDALYSRLKTNGILKLEILPGQDERRLLAYTTGGPDAGAFPDPAFPTVATGEIKWGAPFAGSPVLSGTWGCDNVHELPVIRPAYKFLGDNDTETTFNVLISAVCVQSAFRR